MKNFTILFLIMLLTSATLGLQAQYCTPPQFTSGPWTGILNVTLGTINNTTSGGDGYTDYVGNVAPTIVTQGGNPSISLSFEHTLTGGPFTDNVDVRVWVDWNQDDDFVDPGEEVVNQVVDCSTGLGSLSTTIAVPVGALTGNTRMRVYEDMLVADGHILPETCGYLNFPLHPLMQHGECEDYELTVAGTGLSITTTSTNADCGGSNGTATANPTTGAPPYTYLWDPAANNQVTQQATGLAAGTYSVTVTDNVGATGTASETVNNPNPPTVPTSVTNVTVFGGNDGTATANPTGGTPPYTTYLWDAAAANQTTQQAIGLIAGTYSVTVTDNANCTGTGSAIVDQPIGIQETGKPSNGLFVYRTSDDVFQIGFEISENASVALDVYNVLGQRVLEIENGMKNPGEYRYTFDKTQLSNKANIYFATLRVDDTIITKKFAVR